MSGSPRMRVAPAFLVGQAVWFALLLCVAFFIAVWLAFSVLSSQVSLDIAVSSAALVGLIVPFPALFWSAMLAIGAARGIDLGAGTHAGLAILAALAGVPGFMLIYYLLSSAIRAHIDPRFDDLGYLGGFSLLGSIGLVAVFPILALALRPIAWRIGIGGLMPRSAIARKSV